MSQQPTARRTALFDEHKKLGAKLIDFGGWDLPASYDSVITEHKWVREACGLFDVSHMGEIRVSGPDAFKFLQWITVNDVSRLEVGQGQYSAFLNSEGGMIDDLILYRLGREEYLLCVNAANDEKDIRWVQGNIGSYDVEVRHESHDWSQIAVQGPTSLKALENIIAPQDIGALAALDYMDIGEFSVKANQILIARTGYTGERGYEVYAPNIVAAELWRNLVADKARAGTRPIGLGARDTLRLEACYLLYGNDMNDTVSPVEAGVAWAVKKSSDPFIGCERVRRERAEGSRRRMVAFLMEEPGIPRHDMDVYSGERKIGLVTSGSMLPTLDRAGGMALLDGGAELGASIHVDIRGKRKLAKIVKRPLYNARVK